VSLPPSYLVSLRTKASPRAATHYHAGGDLPAAEALYASLLRRYGDSIVHLRLLRLLPVLNESPHVQHLACHQPGAVVL